MVLKHLYTGSHHKNENDTINVNIFYITVLKKISILLLSRSRFELTHVILDFAIGVDIMLDQAT